MNSFCYRRAGLPAVGADVEFVGAGLDMGEAETAEGIGADFGAIFILPFGITEEDFEVGDGAVGCVA